MSTEIMNNCNNTTLNAVEILQNNMSPALFEAITEYFNNGGTEDKFIKALSDATEKNSNKYTDVIAEFKKVTDSDGVFYQKSTGNKIEDFIFGKDQYRARFGYHNDKNSSVFHVEKLQTVRHEHGCEYVRNKEYYEEWSFDFETGEYKKDGKTEILSGDDYKEIADGICNLLKRAIGLKTQKSKTRLKKALNDL